MTIKKQRDMRCMVLSGENFHSHVFCGAILTGKTWSANKDHLGQNDRQLKLYTLINFVGPSHLVLMHF